MGVKDAVPLIAVRCPAPIDELSAVLRHFDLRRLSVVKSVPSAVADGCSDCRFPIDV